MCSVTASWQSACQEKQCCLSQARELRAIALKVRAKRCSELVGNSAASILHPDAELRRNPPSETDYGMPVHELPTSLPSLDFKLLWHSQDRRDTPLVSIWRPKAPPGYATLGDVIAVGLDPPQPVQVRLFCPTAPSHERHIHKGHIPVQHSSV